MASKSMQWRMSRRQRMSRGRRLTDVRRVRLYVAVYDSIGWENGSRTIVLWISSYFKDCLTSVGCVNLACYGITLQHRCSLHTSEISLYFSVVAQLVILVAAIVLLGLAPVDSVLVGGVVGIVVLVLASPTAAVVWPVTLKKSGLKLQAVSPTT